MNIKEVEKSQIEINRIDLNKALLTRAPMFFNKTKNPSQRTDIPLKNGNKLKIE
jgi:hypothetical protein